MEARAFHEKTFQALPSELYSLLPHFDANVRDGMEDNAKAFVETYRETHPHAVKDLAAKANGGGTVHLTWTAPGDDGDSGAAAEYQIKYANMTIKERSDWRNKPKEEISFWAATNCKGEPKPRKAGTKESFTVKGLKPGTYYFALKTYDEQPNQSDLSNVVKVVVQ